MRTQKRIINEEKEKPLLTHTPKSYYFLASPYNGSEEEKKYRYLISQKVIAMGLERGINIFAPILYNQAIIESLTGIMLEERRKLLMPMNLNFLYQPLGVLLLKIEGWESSWGLRQYIEICEKNRILFTRCQIVLLLVYQSIFFIKIFFIKILPYTIR